MGVTCAFRRGELQIIPVTSLTLLGFVGDANALAGMSQDGRTAALYRPVTGWGADGGAVPKRDGQAVKTFICSIELQRLLRP